MTDQKRKRLLIIDGTNIFIRSYLVNPSLTRNGEPCGGLVGSLQSLQKFIRESNPFRVIWTWDGVGGSRRRKGKNKNYKFGRSPAKMNWKTEMTEEEQYANKSWQMARLSEYLQDFPIFQLIYDDVEADDIISFVAQHSLYEEWNKIIVSADKDFIQLVNDRTILYRPTQKEILNVQKTVEKYQIHPNNFLLARAICGDSSDNLKGVASIGLPTVAKRFPFLKEEKQYFIADIIEACRSAENKKIKCWENILAEETKVRDNYSLMSLANGQFSIQDKDNITKILSSEKLTFVRSGIVKKMVSDGIPEYDFNTLFQFSNRVINLKQI